MTWTCPVAGCSPFWCSHWESGPLTETEFRFAAQQLLGVFEGPELWCDWKWLDRRDTNSKLQEVSGVRLEFAS